MEKSEIKYGFTVVSSERVDEVDGTVIEMLHEKSGARLILLDRRDENMTFAIGFKTTATDDTGVFHILEHSLLCGSKKFPIKDPFTELIKGSITTYLNAMTSGDKTLYPVASKNAKAFHGLVDVYLDAVFNPLALENPYIFMQEGHRLEIDEDGRLSVTGVVYNEMQGVYANADEFADYYITRLVCPGGTYSYDSGGHPDFITDLTFEDFKAAHDKFYHPSNAVLFLDGDVALDEILPLIDSYLSAYDKRECNIEIDDGAAPITEPATMYYPIEEEEDVEDKSRIYLCYNSYDHTEGDKSSALSLVTEALSDLNTSPLTKRILDTGLCESFSFFSTSSYKTNALNAIFIGVKDGKENELIKAYDDAIADILASGISKDTLRASLKRREFNVREADHGTFPKGMVYMQSCVTSAIFGSSPAEKLKYERRLKHLNDMLGTDYYEDVLREIVTSPRSTLILHPDPDLTAKREAELEKRLAEMAEGMTDEEKAALREENARFREWQETPDTPEALATLPKLTVDDLKTAPRDIPTSVELIDGVSVVSHPLHTGGISYLDLYFDASDADEDELHYIRLFTDLLFEWDTARGSSTDFRNRTKEHLGSFFVTPQELTRHGEGKFYILLHASCLAAEKAKAVELIEEYLYSTIYTDREVIKKNLKQFYTYAIEGIISRGDSYANMRDGAKHSIPEAIIEHVYGFEYHLFIKSLLKNIEKTADEVLARLRAVNEKYFCRERLTVGITEPDGLDYARSVIDIVHSGGTKSGPTTIKLLDRVNEGIAIPAAVSFASRGALLKGGKDGAYSGAYSLLQGMASFEILWNEIRLKRGAYDVGISVKINGSVSCYSYRDPSPAASVDYFAHLADELDAFLDTSPDLLRFLIGIFGRSDTVTTPRNDGALATRRFLSGTSYESLVQRRRECLDATVDELKKLNAHLREAIDHSTFTVVGPRAELEKIEGIDRILDI